MGPDFVHDLLGTGQRVRVLSVLGPHTRECLALEVHTSFASRRVARVLERLIAARGRPESLRCDNGPELTSRHLLAWCVDWKVQLVHIGPGRPMQNGRVESFQGKFRDECLNVSWFRNLWEARGKVETWRREYNQSRAHSSLGYQTPEAFVAGAAPPASPPHAGGSPQDRGECVIEFHEFCIRKCADLEGRSDAQTSRNPKDSSYAKLPRNVMMSARDSTCPHF